MFPKEPCPASKDGVWCSRAVSVQCREELKRMPTLVSSSRAEINLFSGRPRPPPTWQPARTPPSPAITRVYRDTDTTRGHRRYDTTHESGQAGFKTLAFSEMCDAFSHVLGQGRKCCPLLVGSANFTLIQCLTCSDFALHNAHVEV